METRERQDHQDLGTELKWDLEEKEDAGGIDQFWSKPLVRETLNPGMGRGTSVLRRAHQPGLSWE